MPNTRVIVLVDTKAIEFDQTDKKENSVIFYDNRLDPPGNGKNFKSFINRGKKITWKGRVMGSIWDLDDEDFAKDSVDIIKVEHTSGAHLLKKDTYTGTKTVVGEVKDDDEVGIENYAITIKVCRDGKIKEYRIDPKMHK